MRFTDLVIRALPGNEWEIMDDFYADLRPEISQFRGIVWIPKGFTTDLASIPHPIRGLLDIDSEVSAVIHDYGIKRKHLRVIHTLKEIHDGQIELTPQHHYNPEAVSRRQIDAIFRKTLRASGVSRWRCWVLWSGVRIGALF